MGCECIKYLFRSRRNDDEDEDAIDLNKLLPEQKRIEEVEEDPDLFNYEMAKNIVKRCFSCEEIFSNSLKDIVLTDFNEKDFQNLFEGFIGDDNAKNEICEKYQIYDQKEFIMLTKRFENFQSIFTQWYKEKKYYKYLEVLWVNFPLMNVLKEKYLNEEELNNYLQVINYSEWDTDIKKSFKRCISNSPEIKSCEISNFINNNYPEVKDLINSSLNYKKNLKNYYSEGMEEYQSNLIYITKSLIKEFTQFFFEITRDNIKNIIKGSESLKESIINKTELFLFQKYDDEENKYEYEYYSFINYQKVHDLNCKLRNGEILKILEECINKAFKTNLNIIGGINVAMGLLELITSIHELGKCFFCYHDNYYNKFKQELNAIFARFNTHKNIGIIPENFESALKIIYNAIEEINKDRNDIIDLIIRIDNEISYKKIEKKKKIFKIVKNIAKIGIGIAGGIVATGPAAIVFGITATVGSVRAIQHSKNLHDVKKDIKNYRKIYNEAIEIENKIKEELDNLLQKYIEIKEKYNPKDYKDL